MSLREYKYWIALHGDRKYCWIIYDKLDEMLDDAGDAGGTEGTEGAEGAGGAGGAEGANADSAGDIIYDLKGLPKPTKDTLEHVYLVDFSDERIISVVQATGNYYLIDLKNKGEKSAVMGRMSLGGLVKDLGGSLRKKLKLKLRTKAKLRPNAVKQLAGVVSTDFIDASHSEQVKLFRKYAARDEHRLDLSGLHLLEPSVMLEAGGMGAAFHHKEIVLFQNIKVIDFEWLQYFPNCNLMSVWYSNDLEDEHVQSLATHGKALDTVEFHYCQGLTGRVLMPLSTLPVLDKLIINYNQCVLQESLHETVITEEEWKSMENNTLSLLLLNSHNLTLDFIDYVLRSFTTMTRFVMDEKVLQKLEKNSADGLKDKEEPITFCSVQDIKTGFKRYRDVHVYDLVKNKGACTISDSMMNVIKQQRELEADARAARDARDADVVAETAVEV